MRVAISGLSFKLTDAIVRRVETRVEAALGWAGRHVGQVMVRLDDINGPRGGRDKRCRIVAWMGRARPIVAEAAREDLYAAVDLAAAKAENEARHRVARRRALRRSGAHGHGQTILV